tara:strand:- start:10345 stop:10452 length:108 start_codon:yes stop_codon:yes gene_type:complete
MPVAPELSVASIAACAGSTAIMDEKQIERGKKEDE